MTAKHYRMIAATLRSSRDGGHLSDGAVDLVAVLLANAFANDNPLFDTTRFLDAAGTI